MKSPTWVLCALAVTVGFVWTSPAHAYLDPGTGSMVLQAPIAGFLTVVFTAKVWWRTVRDRVSRMFSKKEAPPKNAND